MVALDGNSDNCKLGDHKIFEEITRDNNLAPIAVQGGRGIIISPDINKPVITNSCLVVCCKLCATYLMSYRSAYKEFHTLDNVILMVQPENEAT